MIDRLPGTTIEIAVPNAEAAKSFLDNAFICGGLMMSQVARLTGLEPYIIQNWVKRGFLPPPQKKLYTKRQFCRIAIINMLRETMQIERITGLLSYINGRLDDESDDIVDDSDLYFYYISAICEIKNVVTKYLDDEADLANFKEPFPGGKKRLVKVLAVMINAHLAAVMKKRADDILNTLD